MENFEKMKIMCKKQEISRQSAPTIFGNELRSKSLICICAKAKNNQLLTNKNKAMKYEVHIFYSGEIKHFNNVKKFQNLIDTLDRYGFLYCVYKDGIRDETYEY